MKKFIKIITFLGVFIFIFFMVQSVLHHRWNNYFEDIYRRCMLYEAEPENSIDVLYFGTSEIYAGVFPTCMYEETGITGVNMAVTSRSAVTSYYQLEYTLKHQQPKVVCYDFASLFDPVLPADDETIYRKMVDTIPDWNIKLKLIKDIKKLDDTQSVLSYLFPLLRYHSIWNELTDENFQNDKLVINPVYQEYAQGCLLFNTEYHDLGIGDEIYPELWEQEEQCNVEISDISVVYCDKFIEMCNERGIKVVAIIPPRIIDASKKVAREDTMNEYLESRGVAIADYNTYEAVTRVGLTLKDDFWDSGHLNYKGAVKISRDLAHYLKDNYQLDDHRGEEMYKKWDEYWDRFITGYGYGEYDK